MFRGGGGGGAGRGVVDAISLLYTRQSKKGKKQASQPAVVGVLDTSMILRCMFLF
jgi:hypothetical protein